MQPYQKGQVMELLGSRGIQQPFQGQLRHIQVSAHADEPHCKLYGRLSADCYCHVQCGQAYADTLTTCSSLQAWRQPTSARWRATCSGIISQCSPAYIQAVVLICSAYCSTCLLILPKLVLHNAIVLIVVHHFWCVLRHTNVCLLLLMSLCCL